MSGLRDIKRRIVSVSSTKQITKAMKLVSAAKLKKAQDIMHNGQEFAYRLGAIIMNALEDAKNSGTPFVHPLIIRRKKILKTRVIVIGTDRGLCGGFNMNLFKEIEEHIDDNNGDYEFVLLGKQVVNIAKRLGLNIVAQYSDLPEKTSEWRLEEIVQRQIMDFESGKCDRVCICYTKFNSAVFQQTDLEEIIPLSIADSALKKFQGTQEIVSKRGVKYNTNPQQMLGLAISLMVSTILKQAIFESKASEHAARMTAMDSATHNADELIGDLRLFYNRARQSAITAELLDVLGGANAVKA